MKSQLKKRKFIAKTLTTILFVSVFIVMDVFNLQSYTKVISQNISTRFFSYYYPRTPDDIVVINTDENSTEYWPPSYRDYAQWLEYIADYKPRAVFFDINFIVREDPIFKSEFIDAIKYAKEKVTKTGGKIKIYGINVEDSNPEISDLLIPVSTRWEIEEGFYPTKNTDGISTAAFKIYHDLYQPYDGTFSLPMFIKWPSRPPKEILSAFAKFYRGLCLIISACNNEQDKINYLDKFTTHEMYLTDELAQKKFGDRIVFFGSEREADKDFFPNPVYGQIPGVFAHAMALDNLIKYKDQYFKRDDSKPIILKLGSGGLIEIIILLFNFVFFLRFECTRKKIENHKDIIKVRNHAFWYTTFCTFIIIFGILLSHIYLRNDPGNIIGLLATNLLFYEFIYFLILSKLHFLFRSKGDN